MILALLACLEKTSPDGGVSPLAWSIIVTLCGVIAVSIPALWYRGNKIQDKMYADLKECNKEKAKSEEAMLGQMKVIRLQMERSRGGTKE